MKFMRLMRICVAYIKRLLGTRQNNDSMKVSCIFILIHSLIGERSKRRDRLELIENNNFAVIVAVAREIIFFKIPMLRIPA